jgi:hypothetical protein
MRKKANITAARARMAARWTMLLRDCTPTAIESPGPANRIRVKYDAIIKGFARASKDRTRSGVPVEREL